MARTRLISPDRTLADVGTCWLSCLCPFFLETCFICDFGYVVFEATPLMSLCHILCKEWRDPSVCLQNVAEDRLKRQILFNLMA